MQETDNSWHPLAPNGWQPCLVCDLLTDLEDGLCEYCIREAQFLSVHNYQPPWESRGALEAPVTVILSTRRRLFNSRNQVATSPMKSLKRNNETNFGWGARPASLYPESRIQFPRFKWSDPEKERPSD